MAALLQFVYLQLLDLLTTLVFLMNGVEEANPLVRMALGATGSPLLALAAVKCLAVLLGLYTWRCGRLRALRCANVFFALLVAWNLVALLASPGVGQG